MRWTALLGLVAIIAALAFTSTSVSAQGYRLYPWCANYNEDGVSNCSFSTRQQCEATISGIGGTCEINSFYAAYGPYYPLGGPPNSASGF